MFIAHKNSIETQSVEEHLQNVSKLASEYADKLNLKSCGDLIGKIHDVGKFTNSFTSYILGDVKKSGLDHATAGAIYLYYDINENKTKFETLTAEILSICIMSHHGGLIDVFSDDATSPFKKRLEKISTDNHYKHLYEESIQNLEEYIDRDELKAIFKLCVIEIETICDKIQSSEIDKDYSVGLVCKMLYSCLIDADRYDAARFSDNLKPEFNQVRYDFNEISDCLENNISKFPLDSKINKLRAILSKNSYVNKKRECGTYTLTCPTGSGKTISSLRFALNHAKEHGKERIFYIIPFLTIIEQNVLEIKKIINSEDVVLELHSMKEIDESQENLKQDELISERFDKPIVVMSMVRFLNTVFAGGTKNIRPLHMFANSIFIFDEIQTLSPKHIAMFSGFVNFLRYICNTTVVLSTATKPSLNIGILEDVKPIVLQKDPELSGCSKEIIEAFRRTNICDKSDVCKTIDEISDFIMKLLEVNSNLLVILNTKQAVKSLYLMLKERIEIPIFILTTNLYPKHRKEKLEEVKKKLKTEKILVISTQLIEAGVDISFNCVCRSLAGLDSIIQAAGRCNRHGKYETSQVYLINPDFEDLVHLNDIDTGREVTKMILRSHREYPDCLGSIDSGCAINLYFKKYYEKKSSEIKYIFKTNYMKKGTLYDLLSSNISLKQQTKNTLGLERKHFLLSQSFKTASKNFEAIENFGEPVIVSHKESKELISQLVANISLQEKYKLLRELQKYIVNISNVQLYEIEAYTELGIRILREGYYDEVFGISQNLVQDESYFF